MRAWQVEDFDSHGNLRVRRGMWWALFLLAHPWWLLAFEMSVEQGRVGYCRRYIDHGDVDGRPGLQCERVYLSVYLPVSARREIPDGDRIHTGSDELCRNDGQGLYTDVSHGRHA
ncbi:hypothetical protein ACVXG9_28640 [Escherichia coli]